MLVACVLISAAVLIAWHVALKIAMKNNDRTRDLSKSTVVLTGGTDGIGKYFLIEILKMTPKLMVFVGRDIEKAFKVIHQCKEVVQTSLQKATSSKDIVNLTRIYGDLSKGNWVEGKRFESSSLIFCQVDLADLDQIRAFADYLKTKLERVDILVNNAGGLYHTREKSRQNIEMTIASNYLGHLWLTDRLMPLLRVATEARIINLSSCMHWMTLYLPKDVFIDFDDVFLDNKQTYDFWYQYSISKLSINLATKGLVNWLDKNNLKNIKTVTVFPGVILTSFNRGMPPFLYLLTEVLRPLALLVGNSIHQGAQVMLHTALEDFEKLDNGAYYFNCKTAKENVFLDNSENVKKFWQHSIATLKSTTKETLLNISD